MEMLPQVSSLKLPPLRAESWAPRLAPAAEAGAGGGALQRTGCMPQSGTAWPQVALEEPSAPPRPTDPTRPSAARSSLSPSATNGDLLFSL